jgi:uncharacterized protein
VPTRSRAKSMPSLRDSQRRFAASVFASTAAADPGLAIYRRNLRGNFAKVLALEFPVVRTLVGGEYFESVAWQFQQVEPSRSGNLLGIGATFANYLRGRFGGGDLGYLGDVAELEWAVEQGLVAADACASLDLRAFASVPAEQQERLRFDLDPSLRLVRSRYPIVTLWRCHTPDADGLIRAERDDFSLDLRSGGENALVLRRQHAVVVESLSAPDAAWLGALVQSATLGEALELALDAATRLDAPFDLGAVLGRAVQQQWFTGFAIT